MTASPSPSPSPSPSATATVSATASATASAVRHAASTGFDPANALPWAVPLIVLAPLAGFVLAITSVRTRRSSANLALLSYVVMLLATLLAGWGLAKKSGPFSATYQYINLPVAFQGPANFQGFGIDIILRADHLTIVALIVIEVVVIATIAWHRVMGRGEPGAARYHAQVSALLFAFAGVLVSWDLAALLAFWGMAGILTYLIQTHRWGVDEAAGRARVALALPFVTDLSFLSGVAWLYSRYGVNNFDTLIPILHTNPGWTVRSLVVAAVLLVIGVGGRLALWPLHAWLTQTATSAPASASAIAQAAWSVVAIVVLYRLMPIVAASNTQTLKTLMYAVAASAALAALFALATNEPRRVITLLGSAATGIAAAVVIHGYQASNYTFAVAGVAAVLAAAPARAAALLAMSAIAAGMRTDDLAEMGEAWTRMRASALTLALADAVLTVATLGAVAFGIPTRSYLAVLLGWAVLLVGAGATRVFLAGALGPLRRRRAFDPDRVREAPSEILGWPYLLVLAAAGLLTASLIRGWLDFLDGKKHVTPPAGAFALWVAIAIVGVIAAAIAYGRAKEGALMLSAFLEALLDRGLVRAGAFIDRFLVWPATDLARRVDVWLPSGDGALGRFAGASGRLAVSSMRAPVLPFVVIAAVILAVLVVLVAPGLVRW